MDRDRTDEARATYVLVRKLAPFFVLAGIVFYLVGTITLVNLLVAVTAMIAVFALATWQLRRPVPWQLPRRTDSS